MLCESDFRESINSIKYKYFKKLHIVGFKIHQLKQEGFIFTTATGEQPCTQLFCSTDDHWPILPKPPLTAHRLSLKIPIKFIIDSENKSE